MERKAEAPLILIIDDNKQNVQLLKVCLESKEYRTLVAYDGEEGIGSRPIPSGPGPARCHASWHGRLRGLSSAQVDEPRAVRPNYHASPP